MLRRRLDRERLKRKASVEAVDARLVLETIEEVARWLFSDGAVSIQKLPPQRQMLKAMGRRASRCTVRARKEATIRVDVVEPRRAYHSQRRTGRSFHVLEEAGQLRPSSAGAFDRQRRLSIQIGIVEVEPDALTTPRRVRKASDGRYDSGTGPRAVSRQVKIVRPFVDACRSLQADQIRLPCRIGGVEVTPETESDVEVGVFEENARERQARERRHPVGESKLQIEERLRVPHRRAARDRGAPRVPRGATSVWGAWGDRGAPRVPRGATSAWGVWGAISGPPTFRSTRMFPFRAPCGGEGRP